MTFSLSLALRDVDFLPLDFTSLDLPSVYLLRFDFLPPNRPQVAWICYELMMRSIQLTYRLISSCVTHRQVTVSDTIHCPFGTCAWHCPSGSAEGGHYNPSVRMSLTSDNACSRKTAGLRRCKPTKTELFQPPPGQISPDDLFPCLTLEVH